MRTLQRFATVCFLGAAFAALVSACGSSDASPPASNAGAPGAAGHAAAGAPAAAGAAAAGAPAAGGASGGASGGLIGNAANGKTLYASTAVGCYTCHGKDDKAGEGDAGPNITASKAAGIGNWTEAQFHGAVRNALDKTNVKLYFLMPALDATVITDQGIADIYAFLISKTVETPNAGSYCTMAPGMCKGTH